MNPPAIVQPVDLGIAHWTLGVVVKGLKKHLEDNQLHYNLFIFVWFCFYSF